MSTEQHCSECDCDFPCYSGNTTCIREPAALVWIEPVAWMAWDDAHSRNVFATGEIEKARTIGYSWIPLYAATVIPAGCDDEGCPHYGTPHSHGKLPAGWVLVPEEPTPEMEQAGVDYEADSHGIARQIYRAMLSAAPKGE